LEDLKTLEMAYLVPPFP